jgi:hypothetical protein
VDHRWGGARFNPARWGQRRGGPGTGVHAASRVRAPLRTVDSGKRGQDGRSLTAAGAGGRWAAPVRVAWSRGGAVREGGDGTWAMVALGCWVGWERRERARPKMNRTLLFIQIIFKKT